MILAYWISPDGVFFEIEDHPIKTIIQQPEVFGYKLDEMQIVYAKYDDENEAEGEATKVVIRDLLEKGWIYCHKRNSHGDWIAEVTRLDKPTRLNIQLWIQELQKDPDTHEEMQLRIYRHLRDIKTKRSFRQILDGEFFN
jgi:hypothetical protein